jgi:hypothetical protein
MGKRWLTADFVLLAILAACAGGVVSMPVLAIILHPAPEVAFGALATMYGTIIPTLALLVSRRRNGNNGGGDGGA